MWVFDAVCTNIAVRDFKDEKIKEEHLLRILEAGQLCQSGKNLQPWYFIVIRNKAMLGELADLMKGDVDEGIVRKAPTAIAIISDPSSEFHIVDAARAAQNMTLVAWELGIGSCWISGPEPPDRQPCRNMVKQLLHVPESLNLIDLIVLGYMKRPLIIKQKRRKNLEEIAFEEAFGTPLGFAKP